MELSIRDCHPFTKHIDPGIGFDITLDFTDGEEAYDRVPVEVGGRLEAKDGTVLGQLHDWVRRGPDGKSMRLDAGNTRQGMRDTEYLTTLYSPIGEEGIEYLEELREQTEKNDILINIIVVARVLESRSNVSSMHRISFSDIEIDEPDKLEDYPRSGLLTYGYDTDIQPAENELWVISGDGGADFLSVGRQVDSKTTYRIPSRDWTDDFLPELGFGHNLIVDIPDPTNIRDENIADSLTAAFEELERAQAELQRGEWRSVVSHMLGLYDAIDDSGLWELQDAGYSPSAEGCLSGLQQNFSDFLGKFRHRRGKHKDLQEKTEPHREDAYFMYVLMAGLVQLLAKKHTTIEN